MRAIRARWSENAGQVLIIFVLAIPVMLGMCALVIDAGNLFAQKRTLQKAADAAALAATGKLMPDPVLGCSAGTPCESDTNTFVVNYTKANGEDTSLARCDPPSVETNCYELLDNSDPPKVCAPADLAASCYPWRVRVCLSRDVTTFFGGIIGKKTWTVAACARAFRIDGVVGGTTTVIGGSTTVIGGTTIIDPGTTTVIGGTTQTVGGSTTVVGGTTQTIPGSTTVVGGTTIGPITTVVTTTVDTPGKAALLLAKSTACNQPYPLKIGGANSTFNGAVVSNGGVQVLSSGIQGDEMVWGHGTNPACVLTKPAEWGGIIREAPQIYDWFVPIPICIPAAACQPGSSTVATAISDGTGAPKPCTPYSLFNQANPQPGLYCSTSAINLPNNKSLTATGGFGFIAPAINLANGQEYRGYPQLYGSSGGLLFYAYNGNVVSAGQGTGFKGAIFAPLGDVSLAGSSSSSVCDDPGVGGCGFIEALTISLTGANATWEGLGPGFGGGTTTTTVGTTIQGTTNPGTTTTTPDTVTTTPGTTTVIGGSTTVVGGTVSTGAGNTTVTGGTTSVSGGSTTVVGGTTTTKDLNLDK